MSVVMTIEGERLGIEEAPADATTPDADPQPAFSITPSGRLRHPALPEGDRMFAVVCQLSPLGWLIVGPLVIIIPIIIWAVRQNQSPFVDDHCRAFFNFWISMFIWHVVTGLTVIGLVLWPVLWILGLINLIRAAVAAGNGEYFRYPMTLQLFS